MSLKTSDSPADMIRTCFSSVGVIRTWWKKEWRWEKKIFHTDSGHGFLFAVELGVGISVID
jgi:hypothetical protein